MTHCILQFILLINYSQDTICWISRTFVEENAGIQGLLRPGKRVFDFKDNPGSRTDPENKA